MIVILLLTLTVRYFAVSNLKSSNMETTLNRVELRGRVGQDPKIFNVGDTRVARFSVATNETFHDRDGVIKEETTWHNVSAWESKGMPDFTKIEKGTKIHVIGRLRNQRYTDSEGQERYSTEVSAYQMEIIEDRGILQYEFA